MIEADLAATAGVEGIPLYTEAGADGAAASDLPEDRAEFAVRALRRAGPIFRTWVDGRLRVVLAGLEANEFIWRNTELWDYPFLFPAWREQMGPDHLNVLEGAGHRGKRTVLKPAFDQAPAARFLPEFSRCFGRDLAAVLGGGPRDLIRFWSEAIARANTRTVARAEVGERELGRLVEWEHQMLAGIQLGPARQAHYARPEYLALHAEAFALMGRILDERLADPDAGDDNFARVLRARREAGPWPADRGCLLDDLYYILVAGVENTSRLINAAALRLWAAPEWLGRVRAELDGWDGEDPMALAGMPALKAVVMETQRVAPPVFFVPRHAARDFEFGGHRVPAGTTLLHANVVGHFLEETYPEPFAFRPGRFLEQGRFAPRSNGFFGGGVHLCLGRNHTLLQTPVALARMARDCDLVCGDEAGLRASAGAARELPAELWGEFGPRGR
jgi:cytochrome P450